MSDDTPKSENQPSYIAYHVKETSSGKAIFTRIGAGFENRDGKGHNLQLVANPVDGRITIREPQARLEDARKPDKGTRRSRSRER